MNDSQSAWVERFHRNLKGPDAMAVLSITFSNLFNFQEIVIPFEVFGSVTAPPPPPPPPVVPQANITAVARQIDNNALASIPGIPPNNVHLPFSTEISVTDCPVVNAWYMLTVYGWDTEGACTLQSVTFKRVAGGPPPGGGGLP